MIRHTLQALTVLAALVAIAAFVRRAAADDAAPAKITYDDQVAKLRLIVETAQEVWG